jgi:tetratricopeptide (TPR) repeat protein
MSAHEQEHQARRRGLHMKGYSKTTVSVAALLLTGMLALSTDQARAQSVADQLGACKNEAGALQARITACGRVIKDTDDDEMRGEALIQRGVLFEQSDNKEAAIKDYTDAIKLDPSSAVAFFNRGNAYDQLGDYDRAIADYTEAIKLDPNDPDVYINRGQAYDNKGEFDPPR